MPKKSLYIKVSGRVQGVHFRETVRNYANILGLTGFAKNLSDGSVEIRAQGDENTLTSFLKLVEHGSLLSKVTGMEYDWEPPKKNGNSFSVIRAGNIITDQVLSFTNLGKSLLLPEYETIPQHVAIIPDGNRRWAKEKGLPTLEGHRRGFDRFAELTQVARETGIKTFTVWGFSTENWDRSDEEVKYLMKLFETVVQKFSKDAIKNQVHFRHLGRKDRLPEKVLSGLAKLEKSTQNFTKYFLNLALDYGGRDEILRGIKSLVATKVKCKNIDDKMFSKHLDTAGLSDPDLIIRTSGEQRISGLLPWQSTYSELYFAPVHFPDFDASQLKLALLDYSHRQRRFGK